MGKQFMKCPSCQFVCSKLRDICPQCLADLRSFKAIHDIPIIHPETEYSILRERVLSRIEEAKKEPEDPIASFIGAFKKFLTTPITLLPETSLPVKAQEEKSTEPEKVEGVLLELTAETPEPEEEDLPLAEFFDAGKPLEDEFIPENKAEFEVSSKPLHQTPPEFMEVSGDDENLDTLFELAQKEIYQNQGSGSIELDIHQFQTTARREDIVLLFDMALEYIEDPESEKRYVKDFSKSETREVKTKELTSELKKVEKVISASYISLKGWKSISKKRDHGQEAEESKDSGPIVLPENIMPPTFLSFLLACAIDGVAILCVTLFIALLGTYAFDKETGAMLTALEMPDAVAMVSLIRNFMIAALIAPIAYNLIETLFFNRTIGQSICKLLLLSENGHEPTVSNLVVRSLTLPISWITLGILLPVFGKRAPHDRLGKTVVCKDTRLKFSEG